MSGGRKIDEKATKRARDRQAEGIKKLNELFGFDPDKAFASGFIPRGGQTVGTTKVERKRWQQWRDKTFTGRFERRRRRKLARQSTGRNR